MIIPRYIAAATIFFLVQPYLVAGNTEIVNFSVEDSSPLDIDEAPWNLPVLNISHHERQFELQPAPLGTSLKTICGRSGSGRPVNSANWDRNGRGEEQTAIRVPKLHACPHELWVILDPDDYSRRFTRFTLRLSWPAFHPTDFDMEIYKPHELASFLGHISVDHLPRCQETRRVYVRIRAVDTGVLTPSLEQTKSSALSPLSVPFMLTLEPLYLGVVPASVLPTLALLVPVIICAVLLVPFINRYLDGVAINARRQLHKASKTA